MTLLSIETSSRCGSLAITRDEQIFSRRWEKENSHSEAITNELTELLNEAHLSLDQITQVAVGIGPGSFTGLRVGINLARTLSYVFQVPIVGVNSLRVLAQSSLKEDSSVLCMTNAFRNLIYCAGYSCSGKNEECWLEPQALSAEELSSLVKGPVLGLGDAFPLYEKQFPSEFLSHVTYSKGMNHWPLASDLAKFILFNKNSPQPTSWSELKPLYIRGSEAEEKLGRGLLKPLPEL